MWVKCEDNLLSKICWSRRQMCESIWVLFYLRLYINDGGGDTAAPGVGLSFHPGFWGWLATSGLEPICTKQLEQSRPAAARGWRRLRTQSRVGSSAGLGVQ